MAKVCLYFLIVFKFCLYFLIEFKFYPIFRAPLESYYSWKILHKVINSYDSINNNNRKNKNV